MAIGRPCWRAKAWISATSRTGSVVPAASGAPTRRASARAQLVAQQGHGGGRRADPGQACVDHGLGEGGVFGQKAVAGVHGVGAARLCDGDQLADVEVGVGRALAVQGVGFVGHAHVQGVQVVVGIHGHAAQAVVAAGADDAHGDFAPVGDQHFLHSGVPWISANGASGLN
jgi:hypothetical protein